MGLNRIDWGMNPCAANATGRGGKETAGRFVGIDNAGQQVDQTLAVRLVLRQLTKAEVLGVESTHQWQKAVERLLPLG